MLGFVRDVWVNWNVYYAECVSVMSLSVVNYKLTLPRQYWWDFPHLISAGMWDSHLVTFYEFNAVDGQYVWEMHSVEQRVFLFAVLLQNVWHGRNIPEVKVKVKFCPRTGHKGTEGQYRYSPTLSLTLGLGGGGWSMPCPSCFTPREGPGTHCVGGGPQGQSGRVQKILPPPGFDPQTVQKGTIYRY